MSSNELSAEERAKLRFWEVAELLGWFMVIAGCAGEGLETFFGWPCDKTLSHQIGVISWFTLLAGLTLELLAGRRAGAIKDIVVARLGKEAAEARLDLETLNRRSRWRIIVPDQIAAFLVAVKDAPKKGKVTMGVFTTGGEEAYALAYTVHSFLETAGYDCERDSANNATFAPLVAYGPLPPADIAVVVKNWDTPPAIAKPLAEALAKSTGLAVGTAADAGVTGEACLVRILPKPREE